MSSYEILEQTKYRLVLEKVMTKPRIDEVRRFLETTPSQAISKKFLHDTLIEFTSELFRIKELCFEDPTQPIKNIFKTETKER